MIALEPHVPHEPDVTTARRALRLLLVTPRYFPFQGGVQTHVYEVSRRLARAGVDVTLLTTNPGGRLPTEEVIDGVKVFRARCWPADRDYYFTPSIYHIIMRGGWDLVHIQSYHTLVAPLAMLAAIHANVPFVVTFHGGGHSSRLRNLLRKGQRVLLRPLLARACRLIATARFEPAFFGKLLKLPSRQFVYIPNGSGIAHFTRQAAVESDSNVIVSLGRLERYKGHHRVIAAMPAVLKQRPDAQLMIIGSGPYESELRSMARRLGIADRVTIRSFATAEREAMAAALSRAGLVTLLSEYETHPMAMLEAVALGCSVLVADTSGLSELAENGLARAIPLHSSDEHVAQAILEQLQRPMKPANMALPTWDDCAAELLQLYRTVEGERQCAS